MSNQINLDEPRPNTFEGLRADNKRVMMEYQNLSNNAENLERKLKLAERLNANNADLRAMARVIRTPRIMQKGQQGGGHYGTK
jgi:hypothetical protein